MRKILTLGCCALCLTFGFVAEALHVHESADHHEESRGLHVDHMHLGDSSEHSLEHQQGNESPRHDDSRLGVVNDGHHDGDALYVSGPAIRSFASSLRLMPATVSVGFATEPPSAMSDSDQAMPGQPRDPPRKSRLRPRAPPA